MKPKPIRSKHEALATREVRRAEVLDVIDEDTVSGRGVWAPTAEGLR